MSNKLLLFDVDGTIAESSKSINMDIKILLEKLYNKGYTIGIVGGGKIEKILSQIGDNNFIKHYFSECGCVYHKNNLIDEVNNKVINKVTNKIINDCDKTMNIEEIYCKNLRKHKLYHTINHLIKKALFFLSAVDYTITGNFVDLRNGLVYISLIGMSASQKEREVYIELDKTRFYRKRLLGYLDNELFKLRDYEKITISEGGCCGIAIYPSEYDKTQVLKHLTPFYNEIHFFGDKYNVFGNDYKLINHELTIGYKVDTLEDTKNYLAELLYRLD